MDTCQTARIKISHNSLTGNTVLPVVEKSNHTVRVHRLASVLIVTDQESETSRSQELLYHTTYEFVVFEVPNDLLCELCRAFFEGRNTVGLGFRQFGLDRLHVALMWREQIIEGMGKAIMP